MKTGLKRDVVQKVQANEIVRVQWDGEPARTEAARNAEHGGRLQQALDGYNAIAKDPKVTNERLKTDLQYLIARTTARMAQSDPTKADEAIRLLTAFRNANGNSFRYYDLLKHLGRTYLVKKNFANATQTFRQLGQAPWQDTKLSAQIAEGQVLRAAGKPQEALVIYDGILAKTGNSATLKSIAVQAMVGKGACLHLTGKNNEAIRTLKDVIEKTSKTDHQVLANAYVLLGDCYRAMNRDKDALLAYLHVDILFSDQVEYHPRALYHLSKLWAQLGKPTRAGAAKVKLENAYANSEWAKKN
ncbi:MAG: hypothetical protein Tsb009_03390 [Planctomycetaceae bacterium]